MLFSILSCLMQSLLVVGMVKFQYSIEICCNLKVTLKVSIEIMSCYEMLRLFLFLGSSLGAKPIHE